METLLSRHIRGFAAEALGAFPAVVLEGARQVGKSTLASQLATTQTSLLLTLDDEDSLRVARDDSRAFAEQLPAGTLVIDELQRAPELILAIKAAIDRDRRNGRFIMTGSSNLLRLTRTPDSLAGRAITIQLRPFSQGEIEGRADDLLAELRAGAAPNTFTTEIDRTGYARIIARGGYPDARRLTTRLRNAWFDSYVSRLMERDVADLAPRVDPGRISTVLKLAAANQSGEFVKARVARAASLPETTITSYTDLLETMFLLEPLRPWGANLTSRAVSRPKMFVTDPGLALRLSRVTEDQLTPIDSTFIGAAMEGFVVTELWKQRSWSVEDYELFHYRDRDGVEVDVIAEFADGSVIAFEVKSGSTPKPEHVKGLAFLRDRLGDRFIGGYVLNTARQGAVLGDRLWALPVAALWELQAGRSADD
ncbi:ATP-binding protein [Agromyces sp. NPDC127015]|uniref:ATP-binding protein n=1 Tax=Agromyces sp. NPDC127015 TaxID=3347108 RepID=UPI00364E77C8